MAKVSVGPWYWAAKDGWFVHSQGKRHNLKVKGEGAEAEAVRAWHRLMADGPTLKAIVVAVAPTREATVRELADAFLLARKATVKPATHYGYACLLRKVTDAFGLSLAVGLKSKDVTRWLHCLPCSPSTRSGVGGVIAVAYRWAEAEGVIAANPMRGLKRPCVESRGVKAVVTADGHAVLLASASQTLRPVLALLHATGARPSEVCRLTAKDIDLANGVAVLQEHKTSAHGHSRFLVLTPSALAILKPLIEAGRGGALLRNARGHAWGKDALGNAMRRLSKRCGVKATATPSQRTPWLRAWRMPLSPHCLAIVERLCYTSTTATFTIKQRP